MEQFGPVTTAWVKEKNGIRAIIHYVLGELYHVISAEVRVASCALPAMVPVRIRKVLKIITLQINSGQMTAIFFSVVLVLKITD